MAGLLCRFKRTVLFSSHKEIETFLDLMVELGVIDDHELEGYFGEIFDIESDIDTGEIISKKIYEDIPLGLYYVNFSNDIAYGVGQRSIRFFAPIDVNTPFTVKDIERLNSLEPERMKWGKLMDDLRDIQRGGKPNKKITDRTHEIIDNYHEIDNEIQQILGE